MKSLDSQSELCLCPLPERQRKAVHWICVVMCVTYHTCTGGKTGTCREEVEKTQTCENETFKFIIPYV